jgi:hypothetical protein
MHGRGAAVIGEPKRNKSFGSTWRQIGSNMEGIGYGRVAVVMKRPVS